MRKKILLLFSIIVLCIPLARAKDFIDHYGRAISSGCFDEQLVTSATVSTSVTPTSIEFSNGKTLTFGWSGSTFDKNSITQSFRLNWETKARTVLDGWQMEYCCWENRNSFEGMKPTEPRNISVTDKDFSSKRAAVTFYGIDASGKETKIRTFTAAVSGSINEPFTNDEFIALKRYNNIRIAVDLISTDFFQNSELSLPVRLVDWSTVSLHASRSGGYGDIQSIVLEFGYKDYTAVPTISNSGSTKIALTGEPDTKVTGASSSGNGGTTNHSLSVSQMGTGTILLSECNLTNINFALSDVDFYCQTIKSIVLQDANGNVKKTFPTSDYRTIGSANIEVSMLNVTSIADNDKLVLALTNSCTTGKETDYTIILRTEGLDPKNDKVHTNTVLFPSNVKVPLAIAQKAGSKWCDNSSAFFFNVSGANGYTNINFTNATADGASWSVAKGQTQIVGTAQFGKCSTSVTVPIPTINQLQVPIISDAEYCNGSSLNFAIKNPSVYSTETFRLLLDGVEKVGWQGTKVFNNTNLGKVGEATAVVEVTNGECSATSSTAKITSRIQPVTPTFSGATSYYTELENTTITLSNAQAGVTYKIFKNGATTPSDTWTNSKALTLTKGSYRITGENSNALCTAETTVVITEKDLNIGPAWVTTDLSFCQLEGVKDLNSFVTFYGASSVTFTSTAGLSMSGSNVDLIASTAGTYTITCTAIKEGITKIFKKSFTVKAKANDIALALVNATDFSCNQDAAKIQVTTDYPGYTYSWTKGGTALSETTRTITNALTKQEGTQAYVATATATNGCKSTPSTALTLTKHFVEANLALTDGVGEYCQTVGTTLDIRSILFGSDRDKIVNEQDAYTWDIKYSSTGLLFTDSKSSIINLEKSFAQSYITSMNIHRDGCTKTITKNINIKPRPIEVGISLLNEDNLTCNTLPAQFKAAIPKYEYKWMSNEKELTEKTASLVLPVQKTDGLVSVYAIPVLDGCAGIKSNTIEIQKKNVDIDFGFNDKTIAIPSKDETLNIFDYTVGKDKDIVINQSSGYTYQFAFDPVKQTKLETTDGTITPAVGIHSGDTQYLLNVIVYKDGCNSVYTKPAIIKAIPRNITIDFTQKKELQECTNNNIINVVASDANLKYKWYKNDVLIPNISSANAAIEVFKSDQEVKIYAIPTTSEGIEGYKTNNLLTSKRYIAADLQLEGKTEVFCSEAGKKVNIFDYVRGADKESVLNGKFGFSYITTGDCGLSIADNKYIDFDNSLSDDATTYNVALTISQNGCSTTQNKALTIKKRPSDISIELMSKASNTTDKNLFCGGDSLYLKASSSATGAVFNWYKDGGLIESTTTPSLNYKFNDAVGTINLSATLSYKNGCQSTRSNTITVNKKDVTFDIDMSSDAIAYCPEQKKVNLFDYVSGADKANVVQQNNNCSYEFVASGNNGLAIQNYSFLDLDNSTSSNTPYTLTFNVNKQGCKKSFTKNISIKPRPITPVISLTSNNELRFCGNDAVSFADANKNSGNTYKWFVNGTQVSGQEGTLNYNTAQSGNLSVQTIAYLTTNSCASKVSNILNVTNVRPLTEVKLIRDKVTLNETIQFYVFESSTPSKNIKLTGVRTSDKSVFDLMYSRDGNVITLKGMLPLGEYTITGVAENSLSGYCSTDINVSSKLTVIKSTSNSVGNLATKSDEEIARKKIYDEYMAQLKSGEVRSILIPISTSSSENANLCIFSVDENDYANIYVLDGQGKEISRRTEYLNKGENNFTIEANQKPTIAGLYFVKIEYSKSRRVETLKALIK